MGGSSRVATGVGESRPSGDSEFGPHFPTRLAGGELSLPMKGREKASGEGACVRVWRRAALATRRVRADSGGRAGGAGGRRKRATGLSGRDPLAVRAAVARARRRPR